MPRESKRPRRVRLNKKQRYNPLEQEERRLRMRKHQTRALWEYTKLMVVSLGMLSAMTTVAFLILIGFGLTSTDVFYPTTPPVFNVTEPVFNVTEPVVNVTEPVVNVTESVFNVTKQ